MKLNNWHQLISLKKQFTLFFVLIASIPLLVTIGLFIGFFRLNSIFIIISLLLFLISVFSSLYFINKSVLAPVASMTQKILDETESTPLKKSDNEIEFLYQTIQLYQTNIKIAQEELIEKSKISTLVTVASQVAHDIRSPLTALNMVIATLDQLSEDKRIIIRSAIQRINDIANELLQKGKQSTHKLASHHGNQTEKFYEKDSASIVLLSSLVDTLISEKRTQFRDKIGIQIEAEISHSYGLFVFLSPNEFKRLLSNLINNSVEALFNETGKISVYLDEEKNQIRLQIRDNGKGFPKEIIGQIGQSEISFGKEGSHSGSGLGIYHAKKIIESIGGKISFESIEKLQMLESTSFEPTTVVTITIPKATPPDWFIKSINIPANSVVVALDDDKSIHNVWQERLTQEKAVEKNINLLSFTSADAFERWIRTQDQNLNHLIFLIDYELLGQKVTGLDVIEALHLEKQSILVTSRYEEISIQERCLNLGMGIIPKSMATLIPIQIEA